MEVPKLRISRENQSRSPRRLVFVLLVILVVTSLALPAYAGTMQLLFSNSCKVTAKNGSGWLYQNPFGTTTEIENCAQVRADLRYWNGTGYSWKYSGWISGSYAEAKVSNVADWEKTRHGGRNVTGSGGRCAYFYPSGIWEGFWSC